MPFDINSSIANASTLPSAFYQSPDWFERSKEAIFAKSWQFVGDVDLVKVPGAVHPFVHLDGCLDEPLVLTRDTNDQVHCLSNVCTHRGMLVAESGGNERFLRCRYHGRRFGLDGCFQSMPEFEGVCNFPTAADNLAKVPFGQWGPWLFASVNPSMSLEEMLKPVVDRLGWMPFNEFRLDASRCRDYVVRAHWALYVDNYLEGFHIPFIHAALNQAIDYDNYLVELLPSGVLQLAHAKSDEGIFDLPTSSPDHGQRISAYYYWLFPNLMLNFYPWGLSINVVRPVGHDRTRVSFIPYVWREELRGEGAGADLDRVEREDEVVVEAVHKGLKSRFYDRGRYSVAREDSVHHFHRLIQSAFE
ncbi:MAG: aromatic ring-hydroxylating dioxygenase subunit alpha [Armatimonadetes bacterium]|nr:aromatic ring-hydroxylating dioxygenase subunit alpha [Armatimonadota bacterium]